MSKSIFYILVIMCFSIVSCQPGGSSASSNSSAEEGINLDGETTKTAYNGISGLERWVTTKDDKRTSEGDVKNGLKHGSWLEYHKNGLVKDVTHYMNGERSGSRVLMNDRGEVTARESYMNGKLEGEKVKYNRTRIKAIENYKDGQLHGTRKLFYEDANSTIQEEGNFINGKRNGTQKWYDQEGNITIEYEYKNGEKIN